MDRKVHSFRLLCQGPGGPWRFSFCIRWRSSGLYYLSREDRTLTIIIHWNLLGMAAGLLLLWQNCARSQWAMAGVAGFCVIFQIIRIYKLIMK